MKTRVTEPKKEKNFRWYNTGLENKPQNDNEYPVEFLYREALSRDMILEDISFFLTYIPKKEKELDKPKRPANTIFPRYHQSRMVQTLARDALEHFTTYTDIGKKYLIAHSPG